MKAGLVADTMGDDIVNLGVSATYDGGTTVGTVTEEVIEVVFWVE